MKKALFLDRDGVINVDKNYVIKKSDMEFIDGIFKLVRTANFAGYMVIVVTNQSGIGRKMYTLENFIDLSNWMKLKFLRNFSEIDDIFFCPFHPTEGVGKFKKNSLNRKPNPGMILAAKRKYNLDLNSSIMIGDNITDMQAGYSAGVGKLFFLNSSKKKVDIYENVSNLFECIDFINNKNNKIQINYFLKSIKFILLSLVGDDFYINYFNNFDRVK